MSQDPLPYFIRDRYLDGAFLPFLTESLFDRLKKLGLRWTTFKYEVFGEELEDLGEFPSISLDFDWDGFWNYLLDIYVGEDPGLPLGHLIANILLTNHSKGSTQKLKARHEDLLVLFRWIMEKLANDPSYDRPRRGHKEKDEYDEIYRNKYRSSHGPWKVRDHDNKSQLFNDILYAASDSSFDQLKIMLKIFKDRLSFDEYVGIAMVPLYRATSYLKESEEYLFMHLRSFSKNVMKLDVILWKSPFNTEEIAMEAAKDAKVPFEKVLRLQIPALNSFYDFGRGEQLGNFL